MRTLAIESSCDETAAAVVENGTKILSSVLASSSDIHQKTGGVIPEVAAREQVGYIIPVVQEALQENKLETIDALAVTVGPGLIGSLLVGVETTKALAFTWNKPIVPINHLVAHLYANWLDTSHKSPNTKHQSPLFPALCLVVSGGHTDMVLMQNHGKLKYLGGTRDDAAGECFDKTARLLGLAAYYGGPAIAAAANKFRMNNVQCIIKLPRPMMNSNNLEMSFSGLKTAVLREVEKLKTTKQLNDETINYLAYEIQEAITDVLVLKVIKAAGIYKPRTILLAGGVAANQRLREKLSLDIGHLSLDIKLLIPPPKLCTDNASYIASCAYFNYHPIPWSKITADPSLTIV